MARSLVVLGLVLGVALLGGDAHAAPTAAARCSQAKILAIAQALNAQLRCHAMAVRRGIPVAERCVARAVDGLAAAIARAERRGGCATVGEIGLLNGAIDGIVAGMVFLVAPTPTPTASPPPAGTPTATPLPTVTPVGLCDDEALWTCCVAPADLQLGTCFSGMVPLPNQAQAFASYCQTRGGTLVPGRCPVATCGAPATCCNLGGCQLGTSEFFGSPDPDAFAEFCLLQGYAVGLPGTVTAGACPGR